MLRVWRPASAPIKTPTRKKPAAATDDVDEPSSNMYGGTPFMEWLMKVFCQSAIEGAKWAAFEQEPVVFLDPIGDSNPMEEIIFYIDPIGFRGIDVMAEQACLAVKVGDKGYQVGGGVYEQEPVEVLNPVGETNHREFDGASHVTESTKSGVTSFMELDVGRVGKNMVGLDVDRVCKDMVGLDVDRVSKDTVGLDGDRQVGGVFETDDGDDDNDGVFEKEPAKVLDPMGDANPMEEIDFDGVRCDGRESKLVAEHDREVDMGMAVSRAKDEFMTKMICAVCVCDDNPPPVGDEMYARCGGNLSLMVRPM